MQIMEEGGIDFGVPPSDVLLQVPLLAHHNADGRLYVKFIALPWRWVEYTSWWVVSMSGG